MSGRYWAPKQIPIEKVLEVARNIRILADKIEIASQAIAKTDFKEPWILAWPSAEDTIKAAQAYANGLFEQQTKMELGDPGAPKEPAKRELSESTKKTLKLAKKALKSKKPPKSTQDP